MSKVVSYKVLRQHEGDRFYKEGDIRDLSEADAKHLVDLGVLVETTSGQIEPNDIDEDDDIDDDAPQAKLEKAPLNKAEKAAAANKSNES